MTTWYYICRLDSNNARNNDILKLVNLKYALELWNVLVLMSSD